MIVIKRIFKICLSVVLVVCSLLPSFSIHAAEDTNTLNLDCKSAVLMEASTGEILYEYNPDEPLPPASVTKVMTLLLVMEAIDGGNLALTDNVQVSENAASMGGSQVFLEPGEMMSVEDLLKSVVIASANDAAVALGEHIAGSEEAFISRMNVRANELGMKNTTFENATGLDDDTSNHLTSARDIALMSCELMKHETILNYTTIWMDTIRNGEFGLTNTNRLIRFYNGANGLKTGSTSKARFCISAAAKRDNMQLIAVVMGSPTRDIRNECAKKLLDFGFANYSIAEMEEGSVGDVKLLGGVKNSFSTVYPSVSMLVGKGQNKNIETHVNVVESYSAPIKVGEKVGEIVYTLNGNEIGKVDITSAESVEKMSFWGLFANMLKKYLLI